MLLFASGVVFIFWGHFAVILHNGTGAAAGVGWACISRGGKCFSLSYSAVYFVLTGVILGAEK